MTTPDPTPTPPKRRSSTKTLILIAAVAVLLAIVGLVAPSLYDKYAVSRGDADASSQRSAKPSFDDQGTQVGHTLPELTALPLNEPDAEPEPLNALWAEKPTLLITASLSCDQARANQNELDRLARHYDGRLNVAILYTIEAHPLGSECPYLGFEFIPPENQTAGITPEQPETLDQRRDLADQYRQHTRTTLPIYLDPMSNTGWNALGGGPNIAVLIKPGGRIAYKQSWLDSAEIHQQIEQLLNSGT